MKLKKISLSKQLFLVVGLALCLLLISIAALLPKLIIPVIESTIYIHLREPLEIYTTEMDNELANTETAYLYITNENIITSTNINDVVNYKDLNNLFKKEDGYYIYDCTKNYAYYDVNQGNGGDFVVYNDTYDVYEVKNMWALNNSGNKKTLPELWGSGGSLPDQEQNQI